MALCADIGTLGPSSVVSTRVMTPDAFNYMLRLYGTIADLNGGGPVESNHLAEAINYRNLDRDSYGTPY